MSWARNVERVGEERGMYRVLVGKPEGKRLLRIILRRIFRKCEEVVRLDAVGSG
jgi:hypothetical protein